MKNKPMMKDDSLRNFSQNLSRKYDDSILLELYTSLIRPLYFTSASALHPMQKKSLTTNRNAANDNCSALTIHTDSSAVIFSALAINGIAENNAELLKISRN